ncbi:unnamed protein product [Darwinula stevensoni]|uniref:Hepatocyte growth factor-regulated tyrosine kinase substrate n=1 Tax=Darwinula stevensoni TaxID=69355 RepID=A0A7R9FS87_9CRUS|nr:unnamed protein product [Darwinula stevensoni]CAG0903280.1 unnamed protein product [Darwinula stevensoni]
MFRSTSQFDQLLDKATSPLLLEADLEATLRLCDCIRQGDTQPKYALKALKKKLHDKNPHVHLFSLQVRRLSSSELVHLFHPRIDLPVLESWMKNCGGPIHEEVATRAFMDELQELFHDSNNEKVRSKILELVQVWAYAFRNEPRYKIFQDRVFALKAQGLSFPTLKESDAMFSSSTAPEWVDGECCYRCRASFSLMRRKHHCRACGQIFCAPCSSNQAILPKFGFEKEVRICDTCWEKRIKPVFSTGKEGDFTSESSKQSQFSPSKSEAELKEEEDLHLALALSQSEAESKEQRINRAPQVDGPESDPKLARYLERSDALDALREDHWERKRREAEEASRRPTSAAGKAQR